MPPRVYSAHLLSATISSTTTAGAAQYAVPAGKVAVVRSVDMFVDNVGLVVFGRFVGAQTYWITSSQGAPASTCVHWDGRAVFAAGTVMGCGWASGAVRVTVSGYLLDSP